jgi:hypothetical protein
VAFALRLLAGDRSEDTALARVGLQVVPAKCDIWAPWLSHVAHEPTPNTLGMRGNRTAVELRGELWDSFRPTMPEVVRNSFNSDGSHKLHAGHVVCGAPVGTPEYTRSVLEARLHETTTLIDILDELLVHEATEPALHERARLLVACVQPRFGHFAHTVPPAEG